MADIRDSLSEISRIRHFAISKTRLGGGPPDSLGDEAIERPAYWLIPCSHVFHEPAETDFAIFFPGLRLELSAQLQTLLRLTDGAELFRLHYRPMGFDEYWIARYRVLGAQELLRVNLGLLDTFLSYAESDPEHYGTRSLNYLAFCDVGDGNFLAIKIDEPNTGTVLFLDHDYGFYPAGTRGTEEAYVHVADSIEDWLELLARTNGEQGTGSKFIPL